MSLTQRFTSGLAATILLVLLGPAGTASAHDPGCTTVYQCAGGPNQPVPYALYNGDSVLDDVHQAATQSMLCAVDVRVKASDYGTLSVVVYQGSPDDQAPGALLAGPVDTFLPPDFGPSVIVHVEMPSILLPRDSWIGVVWHDYQGSGNPVVVVPHDAVTVGTSHDVWYESIAPTSPQCSDFGDYTANLYLQVYAAQAVPTNASTWGQVKASYR